MTISVRNLTHVYHTPGENVVALSGLDMDIDVGSVVVVRGPNGSGKSTLVRILAGDLTPTAGTVRFGQTRPSVVTLNQFGNVIPDLTPAEHRDLLGVGSAQPDGPAVRAVQLSTAEQQHLAIDLAVALQTDIVLADEPTAFLTHTEAVSAYRTLAQRCRASGTTLLIVTHDERAEEVADTVVRLRDGRLAERWSPGRPEEQALDSAGWLRLPDEVRERFGRSAQVVAGERIWLEGARPATQPDDRDIPSDPGRITHIVSPSGRDGQAALRELAVQAHAHGSSTALFCAADSLGTAQSLADMAPLPAAVSRLDLGGLTRRPLATLSGGQRQRAFLAVALSHPAEVLLIDEPTASLDGHWRAEVMSALREHALAGHEVYVATRDEETIGPADVVNRLRPRP